MKPRGSVWIAIAFVVVAAAFLLHAYSDGSSPTRPKDGVVRLDAKSFGFSLDDILLRLGESAIFEITSRDLGHTFTIDDLMLDSEVPEGQTISVSRPRRRERTPSIVRSPGIASRTWRVLSRYERPAPHPLGASLEAAATDRHTDLQNSSQSQGFTHRRRKADETVASITRNHGSDSVGRVGIHYRSCQCHVADLRRRILAAC